MAGPAPGPTPPAPPAENKDANAAPALGGPRCAPPVTTRDRNERREVGSSGFLLVAPNGSTGIGLLVQERFCLNVF